MSQTIKIHELPSILASQITNKDYMVIENDVDTYKIKIGDLKEVFSSDKKVEELQRLMIENLESFNTSIREEMDIISEGMSVINQDIEILKKSFGSVSDSLITTKRDIDENIKPTIRDNSENIQKLLDQSSTLKQSLEKVSATLGEAISDIEKIKNDADQNTQTINEYSAMVVEIQNTVNNINSRVDSFIEDIGVLLSTKNEMWASDLEETYLRLKKQIDYWHHDSVDLGHDDDVGVVASNKLISDLVTPPGSVYETWSDEDPSVIYGNDTVWELLYSTTETIESQETGETFEETAYKYERIDGVKTTTSKTTLNKIYPKGTVFTTVNDINPNELFGVGEWELLFGGPISEKYIDDEGNVQLAKDIYNWERVDGGREILSAANLNKILPVGSIYSTTLDESPVSIFNGGEWEMIFGGPMTTTYSLDNGTGSLTKIVYKWKRIG